MRIVQTKILNRKENPLLSRTDIIAEVSYDASTPKRADVKKAVAAELKVSEGTVVIKKISPVFGERKSGVEAGVYKDEASVRKIASGIYTKRDAGKAKKSEQ